jgi:large subunit ribosomal protein L21
MDLAVIKTGGKQYLVWPGRKIKIEKISSQKKRKTKKETEIVFDNVLLLAKENELRIGNPLVEGARVIGKIISQKKGEKVVTLKHRPRSSYRLKKGHRQPFTEIEILKIEI